MASTSMPREPLCVLLVEDDAAQAELVGELLATLPGYGVTLLHELRLAGARRVLAERAPDLVLLDLNLPDGRGMEVVRAMRALAGGAPIIVLTNADEEANAVAALREGAEDYLPKRELDRRLLGRAIRYAIERARVDAALRASEERYALALAGANDGLWDLDVGADAFYVSSRWREIMAWPEVVPATRAGWFQRVHEDDVEGLAAAMDAHLAGTTSHFEFEYRVFLPEGVCRWVSTRGLAVRGPTGAAYRIAGSVTDITRRKLAEEQLIHDALHDTLTRLPNRALLIDRLEQAMRRFERDPEARFAILFFDLDRFKTINDSLGHAVGDALLMAVARRLEGFLRPGDTLARLGGDEFAVLLSDIRDNVHVVAIAERVHELLAEVFVVGRHELFASASLGIAISSERYTCPEEMVRDADLAMYRAKSSAGGSYEIFDQAMHESVVALHRVEMDLRRALERDELECHYQTIVSLTTGRVLGFEALLRWRHPQWGLMLPESFIDIAEETGMIVPVAWHVLERACTQTRHWQDLFPLDPPLTISVNVSGKVFVQPDVLPRIEQILASTGLPPDTLRLEVTEKTLMSHAEDVLQSLTHLRSLGIQIYIDDFGTGYSSLSYLQRSCYDSLKIDRSFVRDVSASGDGNAIVKAIVALADSLQMRVIAEGVETGEQLAVLQGMHCDEAQGYHFTRPMDADSMSRHLAEHLLTRH